MTSTTGGGSAQICADCGRARSGKFRRGRCENCYRAHLRDLKQAGTFVPSSSPGEYGLSGGTPPHPGAIALERVESAPGGCWLYVGYVNADGYGQLDVSRTRPGGRHIRVHRAVWEFLIGPIPSGFEVDHLCHGWSKSCSGGSTCSHRRCVNPAHLEPVSPLINNARGKSPSGINGRKTHCIHGHEFTPENTKWRPPEKEHLKPRRQCRACQRLAAHRGPSPAAS